MRGAAEGTDGRDRRKRERRRRRRRKSSRGKARPGALAMRPGRRGAWPGPNVARAGNSVPGPGNGRAVGFPTCLSLECVLLCAASSHAPCSIHASTDADIRSERERESGARCKAKETRRRRAALRIRGRGGRERAGTAARTVLVWRPRARDPCMETALSRHSARVLPSVFLFNGIQPHRLASPRIAVCTSSPFVRPVHTRHRGFDLHASVTAASFSPRISLPALPARFSFPLPSFLVPLPLCQVVFFLL